MPTIRESDVQRIKRIKRTALWSWLAVLLLELASSGAGSIGYFFAARLLSAAVWAAAVAFAGAVILLMVSAVTLMFSRGSRSDDGA